MLVFFEIELGVWPCYAGCDVVFKIYFFVSNLCLIVGFSFECINRVNVFIFWNMGCIR